MGIQVALPSDVRSPIFVGGHHRSGTTLMRVVLHRHPHIACGPESQLLDRTSFREFHRYLEETWLPQLDGYGLGMNEVDRAVGAFMDSFFTRYQLQRGKRRWAEKTPKNILHIDYLFRLFPSAKFIHMIRDPRDIHCSVMAKARTSTPRWESITAERTARSWVKRISKGQQWRRSAQYLEVRYEDFVREPTTTMGAVLSFLNEPWSERVLDPDAGGTPSGRSNVNRALFTTSVGRWKEELPVSDVEQIEGVAAPLMTTLGYACATLSSIGQEAPR